MKERYEKWMREFMEAWKNLDGDAAVATLAPDVEYYENPIDLPCASFDEVKELWKVVKDNQKDIEYDFQTVVYDDNRAVINWQLTRTLTSNDEKQQFDGVFLVSLNGGGLCTYFKQWRYLKN